MSNTDPRNGIETGHMGHSYKRVGKDGRPRYTAVYRDARGARHSAGTAPTRKLADRLWREAELKSSQGRFADPARGKVLFRDYVFDTWLPHHQIEMTTRERYESTIRTHLMPTFGDRKLIDIWPQDVREWMTERRNSGIGAATAVSAKMILSAIFTTALNDQIVYVHPCRGVKSPHVPRKVLTIVTPEQFDAIHAELPNDEIKLMIELDIESGLRWGELVELRPCDLEPATGMLTVSRVSIELNKPTDNGTPFAVKGYPKDREPRRLKLSRAVTDALIRHIGQHHIGRNDLLFDYWRMIEQPLARHLQLITEPPTIAGDELTEPNRAGRRYRHGTLTGYSLGSCKCARCRGAYAEYRAVRREAGKDDPRNRRRVLTDGHVPRGWFRERVWRPALRRSNIPFNVRVHDLRHAHASWLLAGGTDIQVVKERLGHGSLRTTERYLHTLPDADDTALLAFERVRKRNR